MAPWGLAWEGAAAPAPGVTVVTMVTADAGVWGKWFSGWLDQVSGVSPGFPLTPGHFSGLLRTSPKEEGGKQKEGEPRICQLLCVLVDFRENHWATWSSGTPMLFPKPGTQ